MKYNLTQISSFIVILLAFVMLVSYMFMAFYPYKTADVFGEIEIVNEEIHPGDNLFYHFDYCRYANYPTEVSWTLKDGIVLTTPKHVSSLNESIGCGHATSSSFTIPEFVPAGEYSLLINLEYHINPIRTIHKVYETESFYIN